MMVSWNGSTDLIFSNVYEIPKFLDVSIAQKKTKQTNNFTFRPA